MAEERRTLMRSQDTSLHGEITACPSQPSCGKTMPEGARTRECGELYVLYFRQRRAGPFARLGVRGPFAFLLIRRFPV